LVNGALVDLLGAEVVGLLLGAKLGAAGLRVGDLEVGDELGARDDFMLGVLVLGAADLGDGANEERAVGLLDDGDIVLGLIVGTMEGLTVGNLVEGLTEGNLEGLTEGDLVGVDASVGDLVGTEVGGDEGDLVGGDVTGLDVGTPPTFSLTEAGFDLPSEFDA